MRDPQSHNRWKRSGLKTYDGKWAVEYDTCFWWRLFPPEKMDRAAVEQVNRLKSDPRVLDVGCATGRLLELLLQAGVNDICGMDIAPGIITTARERFKPYDLEVELQVGDAEVSIPWSDDEFDAVMLTGVLHHFTDPMSALKEIQRVLKPRGRLIIIDPQFLPPCRQLVNLFLRACPVNGDFRFYSPTKAATLLNGCRFEVEERTRLTWNLFMLVCRKLM